MRILICTSNSVRHKYLANTLGNKATETLIISECRPHDTNNTDNPQKSESFKRRYEVEKKFFPGHDSFHYPTIPILWKEASLQAVANSVADYKPEAVFVFGASILKEPLLSLFPENKTVNLHLGLSPYYRGSGTNFWPFVNKELQYVGGTLLHLDPGIDKGDIIGHIRPEIESGDTIDSIGNKTIKEGVAGLLRCLSLLQSDKELPRTPQWEVPNARYYETKDMTEEVIERCMHNIEDGLVDNYLNSEVDQPQLVLLPQ